MGLNVCLHVVPTSWVLVLKKIKDVPMEGSVTTEFFWECLQLIYVGRCGISGTPPSAQNNFYFTVAYFGVAYLDPLQKGPHYLNIIKI